MTDVKIKNGEIVCDSTGKPIMLSDPEARLQRALIRISARHGSFIYHRGLGSQLNISPDDEFAAEKAELILNEAVADFDDTTIAVLEYGDTVRVKITVDGESKTEEVRVYGDV